MQTQQAAHTALKAASVCVAELRVTHDERTKVFSSHVRSSLLVRAERFPPREQQCANGIRRALVACGSIGGSLDGSSAMGGCSGTPSSTVAELDMTCS